MISNYEIRKRAREILGPGLFNSGWTYPVLIILIISAISGALSYTYVGPVLVTGILAVASASYFLRRVRGQIEANNIEAAIDGVKRSFTSTLIAGILYSLFVSIGTVLFIVPGIIFSFSFSMVFHVLNDHPEMKAMEALKESHRLMKGHRMQYFLLGLSFIGWAILGALCLGVGSLWAAAYAETANAVFYDELVAADRGHFTVSEEASAEETVA